MSLVCSRNVEEGRVSEGERKGGRVADEVRMLTRPDPVGPRRLWLLPRAGYCRGVLREDAEAISFLAWSSGERPRWGPVLGEVHGGCGNTAGAKTADLLPLTFAPRRSRRTVKKLNSRE